jgi:hypothetical protein
MTIEELLGELAKHSRTRNALAVDAMEVRVGDVAEGSDLHCSVGEVVVRGNCLVVVPGDDRVWKDETLATEVLSETLWPQKKEEE